MNNIHTYLQHLGTVKPTTPMILIQGQLQVAPVTLRMRLANFPKKIDDAVAVIKEFKRFLDVHVQELDGRDFPALDSIYRYFEQLQLGNVVQAEILDLQNICRSFETLNAPLDEDAQPALASAVPAHIRTGYRVRIANQTKLIAGTLNGMDRPMRRGTVIEGGESIASLDELLTKAKAKQNFLNKKETEIILDNRDCLDVAADYQNNSNVALLNMANANGPGGGWTIGDNAQEEELFRRTNYHRALMPEENKFLSEQLKNNVYRIPFFGAIFTPSVTVIRDRENQLLPPDQRFQVNMIASAAIDLRPYKGNIELENCGGSRLDAEKVAEGMKQKIRAQLAVAVLNNTEVLILGAFGCGAFRHDPSMIAECYKEVLDESLFRNAFSKVVFSIIDFHKTENFAEFSKVFNSKIRN